jgi:hypothetical protein
MFLKTWNVWIKRKGDTLDPSPLTKIHNLTTVLLSLLLTFIIDHTKELLTNWLLVESLPHKTSYTVATGGGEAYLIP